MNDKKNRPPDMETVERIFYKLKKLKQKQREKKQEAESSMQQQTQTENTSDPTDRSSND